MLQVMLMQEEVEKKIHEIHEFLTRELKGEEKVVIGISGGLDCDVVARIAAATPAVKTVKLFTVIQRDMDPSHLKNARELAKDIGEPLVEIHLEDAPFHLIEALADSDQQELFHKTGLDAMRMKCNIRTCLLSSYQDHGYVVIGTSNRTEFETGFFLPFGDGTAHIKPIVHLYKSQVRQLAAYLGTRKAVLDQPSSAGFWLGEEDMEDLAWWLFNDKPIVGELVTTQEEDEYVKSIEEQLTVERVDQILLGISNHMSAEEICENTGVRSDVVGHFFNLVKASCDFKHRKINQAIMSV